MQKTWFRSRRRTKVRQRAKTRLKITHKNEIRKNFYLKIPLYYQFTIIKRFFLYDLFSVILFCAEGLSPIFIILLCCDFILYNSSALPYLIGIKYTESNQSVFLACHFIGRNGNSVCFPAIVFSKNNSLKSGTILKRIDAYFLNT